MNRANVLWKINVPVADVIGGDTYGIRDTDKRGKKVIVRTTSSFYTEDPTAADKIKQWIMSREKVPRQARLIIYYDAYSDAAGVRAIVMYRNQGALHCADIFADTEPLALCLAILPEERREYYSKMLGECEG